MQGSGWVARAGGRRHQRARRRGRGRHDGRARRRRRARRARRSSSTRTTTSRCCACRGSERRALRPARHGRRSGRGRDPRLPRERSLPRGAGTARADADRDQPGRVRQWAGPPAHDLAARPDPLRELRRAGRRRRRAGGRDGVRRHDQRLERAASACRPASSTPRSPRAGAGRHRSLRALAGRPAGAGSCPTGPGCVRRAAACVAAVRPRSARPQISTPATVSLRPTGPSSVP